ncbi:MAG: metallophosphoesterase, partial [Fusobacteriaceae bacterium]
MKKFLGLFALTMTMVSTNLTGAELTILHTNDLHAHVEPFLFRGLDPNRKVGGFANITTFAKSIKEQEKGKREVLFLDAGDYFTGPYISSLTEGEAIIDIMNTMGYDAVTVGNHEFDHGWENGREKLRKAEFPILLGNV